MIGTQAFPVPMATQAGWPAYLSWRVRVIGVHTPIRPDRYMALAMVDDRKAAE